MVGKWKYINFVALLVPPTDVRTYIRLALIFLIYQVTEIKANN